MIYYLLLAQTKITNGDKSTDLTNFPQVKANNAQLQDAMAIVFGIAAAIAVLIIIISGINFITGGDNPEKISKSKNAIIYALVGLAIAVSAETIILTVLDQL